MKNTTQTVSKGRIVFFQTKQMALNNVEPQVAIITRVHSNETIDVTVIPPGVDVYRRERVDYFDGFDADCNQFEAWWWPPRV